MPRAGRRGRAGERTGDGCQRRRHPGSAGHHDAVRDAVCPDRENRCAGELHATEPAGGAVHPDSVGQRVQAVRTQGHHRAGGQQHSDQYPAGDRRGLGKRRGERGREHGGDQGERGRAGYQPAADHRSADERPAGDAAHPDLRGSHGDAQQQPDQQQELCQLDHHVHRRRAGQRHELPAGRRR